MGDQHGNEETSPANWLEVNGLEVNVQRLLFFESGCCVEGIGELGLRFPRHTVHAVRASSQKEDVSGNPPSCCESATVKREGFRDYVS